MKVRMPYSIFHKITTALTFLVIAATLVFVARMYTALPDQIPVHFNLAGEVDRWGGKGSIWFLPVFSLILALLITVIGHYPANWSSPAITDSNRGFVWKQTRNMLCVSNLCMAVIFAFLEYSSILRPELGGYWGFASCILLVAGLIAWGIYIHWKAKRI